jgi:hypothetical protein
MLTKNALILLPVALKKLFTYGLVCIVLHFMPVHMLWLSDRAFLPTIVPELPICGLATCAPFLMCVQAFPIPGIKVTPRATNNIRNRNGITVGDPFIRNPTLSPSVVRHKNVKVICSRLKRMAFLLLKK